MSTSSDLVGGVDHRRARSPLTTPVIRSTTSFRDSRCCTLTVEMTSIPRPAAPRCPASVVAAARRGGWASSSTSATAGRREDGVEIHLSNVASRYSTSCGARPGRHRYAAVAARPGLDVADDHIGARPGGAALGQHGVRLPTPERTEVHPQSTTTHRCQCAPAPPEAPHPGRSLWDIADREVDEHGQAFLACRRGRWCRRRLDEAGATARPRPTPPCHGLRR